MEIVLTATRWFNPILSNLILKKADFSTLKNLLFLLISFKNPFSNKISRQHYKDLKLGITLKHSIKIALNCAHYNTKYINFAKRFAIKNLKRNSNVTFNYIENNMKKFMLNIQLDGLDNETRMKLLPKEQELVKELEQNGTIVDTFIKLDMSGIFIVAMAADTDDVHSKLSILPYYPYMKIEIIPVRVVNSINQ